MCILKSEGKFSILLRQSSISFYGQAAAFPIFLSFVCVCPRISKLGQMLFDKSVYIHLYIDSITLRIYRGWQATAAGGGKFYRKNFLSVFYVFSTQYDIFTCRRRRAPHTLCSYMLICTHLSRRTQVEFSLPLHRFSA